MAAHLRFNVLKPDLTTTESSSSKQRTYRKFLADVFEEPSPVRRNSSSASTVSQFSFSASSEIGSGDNLVGGVMSRARVISGPYVATSDRQFTSTGVLKTDGLASSNGLQGSARQNEIVYHRIGFVSAASAVTSGISRQMQGHILDSGINQQQTVGEQNSTRLTNPRKIWYTNNDSDSRDAASEVRSSAVTGTGVVIARPNKTTELDGSFAVFNTLPRQKRPLVCKHSTSSGSPSNSSADHDNITHAKTRMMDTGIYGDIIQLPATAENYKGRRFVTNSSDAQQRQQHKPFPGFDAAVREYYAKHYPNSRSEFSNLSLSSATVQGFYARHPRQPKPIQSAGDLLDLSQYYSIRNFPPELLQTGKHMQWIKKELESVQVTVHNIHAGPLHDLVENRNVPALIACLSFEQREKHTLDPTKVDYDARCRWLQRRLTLSLYDPLPTSADAEKAADYDDATFTCEPFTDRAHAVRLVATWVCKCEQILLNELRSVTATGSDGDSLKAPFVFASGEYHRYALGHPNTGVWV